MKLHGRDRLPAGIYKMKRIDDTRILRLNNLSQMRAGRLPFKVFRVCGRSVYNWAKIKFLDTSLSLVTIGRECYISQLKMNSDHALGWKICHLQPSWEQFLISQQVLIIAHIRCAIFFNLWSPIRSSDSSLMRFASKVEVPNETVTVHFLYPMSICSNMMPYCCAWAIHGYTHYDYTDLFQADWSFLPNQTRYKTFMSPSPNDLNCVEMSKLSISSTVKLSSGMSFSPAAYNHVKILLDNIQAIICLFWVLAFI